MVYISKNESMIDELCNYYIFCLRTLPNYSILGGNCVNFVINRYLYEDTSVIVQKPEARAPHLIMPWLHPGGENFQCKIDVCYACIMRSSLCIVYWGN